MTLLAVTLLHVLLAVFWIGGTLFLVAVAAPELRKVEPAELRSRIFTGIGLRFRRWGWFSFAGLIATGTLNLHLRGILTTEYLADPGFWGSPFGRALMWKLLAVSLVFTLSAVHELQSLRADRFADPGARAAAHRRARGSGRWLGVAFLLLLAAAVRLAATG